MKKVLLLLSMVACAGISQAQSTDYTVGNIIYDNVLDYDDGNFYQDTAGFFGSVISDASLISSYQYDAYDGAFEVAVDDSAFTNVQYNSDTNFVKNIITTDKQYIRGLQVSTEFYFPANLPIVRLKVKLENESSVAKTVRVNIGTNLGSDTDTRLEGSSTGDSTLSNSDRWMISSDTQSDTLPYGDPVNTFVRYGAGAIQSMPYFVEMPEQGNDNYIDSLIVTVPANSSIYIVMFNRLDSNVVAARANSVLFDDVTAMINDSLFAYIDDLSKVVNWNFSVAAPTVAASNLNFSGVSTTSMTVNWTNGDGAKRLVLIKQATAVDALPSNGTTYSVSTVFANGAQLGTGNYAIYNGTGTSVNVTGLTPNTLYYVAVIEYNGSATQINYLTSDTLAGNQLTDALPTGVSELYNTATVQLTPNPNHGLVTVNYAQLSDVREIKIINVVGKVVDVIPVSAGSSSVQINTSELANGSYFLSIESNTAQPVVQKMIKY